MIKEIPPYVINVAGWPKNINTKLYVYKLYSRDFGRVSNEGHEYYSTKPVKPISVEVFVLKNYINYIKKLIKDAH